MTGRQYIVSMSGSNSSGDADGDGVPDNQDAYPNDPTRHLIITHRQPVLEPSHLKIFGPGREIMI